MATAKKQKSGKWMCQVFTGYTYKDGKRKREYKAFTADTKREAEFLATQFLIKKEEEQTKSITVGEAISRYITTKESVLSPSTIKGYRQMEKIWYKDIADVLLGDLTRETLQIWISDLTKEHSPKSVNNAYSLLRPAIKMFSDVNLTVTLPERRPLEYRLPTQDELKMLLDMAKGRRYLRLAIMLAAYCSLRRGEIMALEYEDIDHKAKTIHVKSDIVEGDDGRWHKKMPKDKYSIRSVPAPQFVLDEIGTGKGTIFNCSPHYPTKEFKRLATKAGMPEMRFHDLRHFYASYLHAQGIPDAYIEKFGGWSPGSPVMKRIYRGTIDEETKKNQDKVRNMFG